MIYILYIGVPDDEPIIKDKFVLVLFKNILIPFAFIIGIAIYIKVSKNSKKRKIITAIISACIAVALFLILGNIINNL